jgi:phosphoglycerate kinase
VTTEIVTDGGSIGGRFAVRVRTIDDLELSGKRVLVRADFNVPLRDGRITDDTRIRATLPTINELRERGASVILMSHLGRPKGEVKEDLRLRPVAAHLGKLLEIEVAYAREVTGRAASAMVDDLQPGDVGLIENLRFDPREESNDDGFARELASLGDCYVSDAFGAAHRAHASTVGIASHLPAAAGLLMEKEINALSWILEDASQPFVVILGGAKVSDKIGVIENLMDRAKRLIIGGGMANTFLKAAGNDVGASLVEEENVATAKDLMDRAKRDGVDLRIPVDGVVAKSFSEDAEPRTIRVNEFGADDMMLDIGPDTIADFTEALSGARTIVWNGPMGVFEFEQFAQGTKAIADVVAESEAYSLIGGGDSVAAVEQLGLADHISHISTGGGASLEFLEGRELPGVTILIDRQNRK